MPCRQSLDPVRTFQFPRGLGCAEGRALRKRHSALEILIFQVKWQSQPADSTQDSANRRELVNRAEKAESVAEAVRRRFVMPGSLSAMGVSKAVFAAISKAAVADHSSATNPKPATEDDYARMLEESF